MICRPPDKPAQPLPSDSDFVCRHRGELKEMTKCGTCGAAGVNAGIYQCTLHGDLCVVRAWTMEDRTKFNRNCLDCAEFDSK